MKSNLELTIIHFLTINPRVNINMYPPTAITTIAAVGNPLSLAADGVKV